MTVSVNITATGETFRVSGRNISEIKENILQEKGIPHHVQMFKDSEGKNLEDGMTLEDNSSVNLSLNLKGGCWCGDDCQCCLLPCSII